MYICLILAIFDTQKTDERYLQAHLTTNLLTAGSINYHRT
ncbi:hypothetical protein HMPREF9019_0478 [Hoylesella timonensis CRIS 5C-B1]|uniref:Uncharacterized protein n=1 Tax=Hoylesella timonensis CRIS 5C-B1 TaxID=679189 RepID=D1VZ92_9BACT|nr:hypothetical protein HMPREF9019_0478 [Hoylesella timonensis CRIS 5C-B1]